MELKKLDETGGVPNSHIIAYQYMAYQTYYKLYLYKKLSLFIYSLQLCIKAYTCYTARRQTCQPIEFICIDDGSDDDTLSILRHLQSCNNNVYVKTQPNKGASAARNTGLAICKREYIQFLDSDEQKNQGVAKARNKGLMHSKGDNIVFLDADDLLYPKSVETNVKFFMINTTCAFVVGGSKRINEFGTLSNGNHITLLSGIPPGTLAMASFRFHGAPWSVLLSAGT